MVVRAFASEDEFLDLTNPTWIKAKGILFLFLGLLSSTVLFLNHLTTKFVLLFLVAVWSFCRFYYFAFYVIEHYVDPDYRFPGLVSFLKYLIGIKKPSVRG
jgi:hypothetical protein